MTTLTDLRTTKHDTGETETTVRVWRGDRGGVGVTVSVRLLPGYHYWTCPDARTLRRLVDAALAGTGYVRTGQRDQIATHPGWTFRYYTREA